MNGGSLKDKFRDHSERSLALVVALFSLALVPIAHAASDFDNFLQPLLKEKCIKCHGEKKVKGKVNLKKITTEKQFLAQPKLIKEMIEALDAYDMPPEDEPELAEKDREQLLASLKVMLRESAVADTKPKQVRMRRLNRFQYNNAVKDLFQLNQDIFPLPEKLMTRTSNYVPTGKIPERVEVACHSLNAKGGLRGAVSFPKDLRAAHGYDNQANQLTLSPLLLDSFLRLSLSIVESPDFNDKTVGIWNDFFGDPGSNTQEEIRKRLKPFLMLAFRSAIDDETLDRYTAYTFGKTQEGVSFPDAMKKVASAILTSPRFLFRYGATTDKEDLFVIASNISFFLWSSGPDLELLRLAEGGDLATLGAFQQTIDRMMADPKIERFLDSFPSQWMQLENLLGATPDPKLARLFSLEKNNPASLQMILEPLLLFDAIFLENRPVVELITPKFSYQSDFLKTWYTSDLKSPKIDAKAIVERNRTHDQKRQALQGTIKSNQVELDALFKPVKAKLLQARQKGAKKPVDLKPFAAWEFNRDLQDSVGSLHLKSHGKITYNDGMVILKDKAYLQSSSLPFDLKAKTLEVWCLVHNLDQNGGGLMGVQGPGDFFDTIVIGERKPRHWISGSNGFARTLDFPESTPEDKPNQRLHLAMVYQEDGTTTLYRNGKPYGKPFRKGAATFPKSQSSILFGMRHLPAGNGRQLDVSLARARFYNRALTAGEVAGSSGGLYISDDEIVEALTSSQRSKRDRLQTAIDQAQFDLKSVPENRDPRRAQQDAQKNFDEDIRTQLRSQTFRRGASTDPRYGGVITNAAMLSMTSGPKRTHPIARGAWIIEVIFNDPPPPPPNDVPPLNEDAAAKNLTIREKFAKHRENPDCAGCHSRLDPLGFAMENYDIIGRWRDKYPNGRDVDASGTLMKKHPFDGAVRFKESLVKEDKRFAKAFTAHLLRYATSKELSPADTLTIEAIVGKTEKDNFKLKSLIREVILSESFLQTK